MRKALFRKDLWKDVGPKKEESDAPAVPEEKPKLHQHHYSYNRRVRAIGLLQIVTGTFLYFVCIFLPVFGARGYYTEYLIPMGCVSGPSTVVAGIFARETSRKRRPWMLIVYIILCALTMIANFVHLIGAFAAFQKEDMGWKEDLITEPVIATFRYLSYLIILFLCSCIEGYGALSILLDLRLLSPAVKRCCNQSWMLERNAILGPAEDKIPVTTV